MRAENLWISVPDAVAGENLPVRISGFLANEKFRASVFQPDARQIFWEKSADENGKINFEIHSLHTRVAGNYELRIFRNKNFTNFSGKNFRVFPAAVSAFESKIKIENPTAPADGKNLVRAEILLRDAFQNPIADKKVRIFSSRNSDEILAEKKTDFAGKIVAKIKSKKAGISVISALADETLIFEKPEIIFFLAEKKIKNAGSPDLGNFLRAQLFNENEEQKISYFSIENLPDEILADENLSVTILARDENGEIVKNFRGAVRFSSSDDRAKLPADYEFVAADQGQHTFSLSTTFSTPGQQTFSVHDKNNFQISGEKKIEVLTETGAIPIDPNKKEIRILTPPPGKFKSARATISGTAFGCEKIKLVDGENLLVENLSIDENKKFVFQTPKLADGTHKFRAICVDDEKLFSAENIIQIDRTPPKIFSVEVDPTGTLEKYQNFAVKIGSAEPLLFAKCIFRGELIEFDLVGEKFSANFVAPDECGEFPLSCSVADLLGNEIEEPNAAKIKVCADENLPADPPPQKIAPIAVDNFYAENGEDRVTLFWSPAISDAEIKNYQINFGKCGAELTQKNVTPDARTQWYVENLTPCEKYCFEIFAIDAAGNFGAKTPQIEGAPICHSSAVPQKNPTAGISKNFLAFLIAFLAGTGVLFLVRKN